MRFRLASSLLLSGALVVACSDDGTETDGSGARDASSASSGGGSTSSSGSGFGTGGSGGGCEVGTPCEGGVCTSGDVCCPIEQACNESCCGVGDVCSFTACVTPGAECTDSTECAPDEYCEHSLGEPLPDPGPGCIAGAPVSTGKCLPKPPTCPDGTEPDPRNPECLATCEVIPAFPTFAATLKYSWTGPIAPPYATDVMMTPVVLSLDDDDCDGKISGRDIPEIVFSTFSNGAYGSNGVLHAISVVEGVVIDKWTATGVNPTKHLAAGNVDGLPGNEVVGCLLDGTTRAWNGADGTELWTSTTSVCFMPQIADLDGDGTPEVVVEDGILHGTDGTLKQGFATPLDTSFVISDADGDGALDIVTASRIYDASGVVVADTGTANATMFYGTQDWKSSWPAIGDFDLDGSPEVVVVDNLNHALLVWRYDAAAPGGFEIVRAPIDINGTIPPSDCNVGTWGNTHGGGPPTVADFTGDGVPDVATAGGVAYAVFDGAALVDPSVAGIDTFVWTSETVDCSSASTGSTVFDFNGDGIAEVIYGDQQRMRIYDGPTGAVLFEACNTTATLIENPVVADVDNDGQADIVVASNAYGSASPDIQCNDGMFDGQTGIRIFGAANDDWERTRRVWNQHAYHVTNVGEDGSIPTAEAPNWTQIGLNNFRQNKQPGSEFAAPDAVVTVAPRCTGPYAVQVTVRNLGEAVLPPGVTGSVYVGTPASSTLVGSFTTATALFPAEGETFVFPIEPPGDTTLYAAIETTPVVECRTDNNQSALVDAACVTPQ